MITGCCGKGVRPVLAGDRSITIAGEADDGARPVRIAGEQRPDVVIMDIAMPQLNGIAAAAQIARKDKRVGVII